MSSHAKLGAFCGLVMLLVAILLPVLILLFA